MHIILTGNNSQINEWTEQVRGSEHLLYAAFNVADVELDASVKPFSDEIIPVADIIFDLFLENSEEKANRLNALCVMTPRHVPMLSNTLYVTATELAKLLKYPELLVGMAYLPGLAKGDIVEISLPYKSEGAALNTMEEFITSVGKSAVLVEDYVGMVFPRVIVTIINEAVYTLQHGVADEDAIDIAMKLGVNYPEGPMRWGRKIGFHNVLQLLRVLQAENGDDRYRPAPLMRKLAGH